MARYYFDLLDDGGVFVDEEGMDLSGLAAAQAEAAQSLTEIARDAVRVVAPPGVPLQLAIHVRDDRGPLLKVRYTLEIERIN